MTTENNNENTTPDEGIPADRRPLGFWLRAVDGLISSEFATAFAQEGITRRDWMLLNALAGDGDVPWLADRLSAKAKGRGTRLGVIAERGWIAEVDGAWTITDEGRAARARLDGLVDTVRSRVAGAVSPEDFATTMASLEAIARELGWEEGQRMPRRERGRFGRPGFGRGFGDAPRERFGRGFGPDFGPEHPHHGPEHHGHPHHGHPHHGRPVCADERDTTHGSKRSGTRGGKAERAYERGFEAGFSRGSSSQSV